MTSSASVKGRKHTPLKATARHTSTGLSPWTKHPVNTPPVASVLGDNTAEEKLTEVVDTSSAAAVKATSRQSEPRRFHESITLRHGSAGLSRTPHHPSHEIKYPLVLTPITEAFAHPNASAFEIARIGKETRKYISANWGRLSEGVSFTTRADKVNVIRGCAVVLSLTGDAVSVEQLDIRDLMWISLNARRLAPHARALRTETDFCRTALVVLLDVLESSENPQERSSAKRAISVKRSAKSR